MPEPIPVIEQVSPIASDNAVHYGYCPFQDINVADRQVQPANSPYYHVLPKRTLIPFVRIDERDYDPERTMSLTAQTRQGVRDLTVVTESKTAKACIEDVAYSYKDWGFVVLRDLTGLNEQDAGDIFYTIQPFRYALRDLAAGIADAEQRISQIQAYDVTYGDEMELMHPLRDELKPIARKVAAAMQTSVANAIRFAEEVIARTQKNIQKFLAGGEGGKDSPDPLDYYVFGEMGKVLPSMIVKDEKAEGLGALAEALKGIIGTPATPDLSSLAAKEAELDAKIAAVTEIEAKWNAKFRERFKKDEAVAA